VHILILSSSVKGSIATRNRGSKFKSISLENSPKMLSVNNLETLKTIFLGQYWKAIYEWKGGRAQAHGVRDTEFIDICPKKPTKNIAF